MAWNDRLFLTAAVRGDDNSAFGKSYTASYYPKFSASWVISEEPFARNLPGARRCACAPHGDAPASSPTPSPRSAPTHRKQRQAGNADAHAAEPRQSDLKPEVGEEFETGLDATFIDNRLGLEFTYYNKATRDALVSGAGASVTRLSRGAVPQHRRGQEQRLGDRPDRRRVPLAGTPTFGCGSSSRATTMRSCRSAAPVVARAQRGFGQYHVPGFRSAAIFHRRVTSGEMTTVNGQPRADNLMCESGSVTTGTTFSRGGGPPVPCLQAPAVYWGNALPRWEGSGTMQLTLFRNLQLFSLVDFVGGNTILSGDIRASLLSFRNQRSILEANDPILFGYDILDTRRQPGIVKGGFAKLRQVSATYTLPSSLTRPIRVARAALTLSAQNFWTMWVEQRSDFGVKLVDPEIRNTNAAGADPGGLTAYNQEGWPQMRRLSFSVRVTP